eukprot:TRINITY_DN47463_c0_g1_i1.p1 TRINITY_DN47463_c0_g1~~TRINITY_DN47463_c0_g1_i1.p1  ORF type:complete len:536 (+),score=158.08 TRINITY_DN47463_c0_g1_i1:137-1744(+)
MTLSAEMLQAAVILFGSFHVGRIAQGVFRLPAITGYIVAGCWLGPGGLGFLTEEVVTMLRPVEQACLAVIGFAAGGELVLRVLLTHARAVVATLLVMLPCTFALLWRTLLYFERSCPGLSDLPEGSLVAARLLICNILLARSPASALAVVKETRSRGKFTELALATSIALDTVVVSSYGFDSHIAHLIAERREATVEQLAQPVIKLLCSGLTGWALAAVLGALLPKGDRQDGGGQGSVVKSCSELAALFNRARLLRSPGMPSGQPRGRVIAKNILRGPCALVGAGAAVFLTANSLRTQGYFLRIDALLTCVACGAVSVNAGAGSREPAPAPSPIAHIADDVLPYTNVVFFTLVGSGLGFGGIVESGTAVGALFAARILGLVVGAWGGAMLAGLSSDLHPYRWMGFVTQAGVALGLCKQAAAEFPGWGQSVYSIGASVICCNLIVGPLCFKYVLHRAGESGPEVAAESRPAAAQPPTAHRSASLRVPPPAPSKAAETVIAVEEIEPAGSGQHRRSATPQHTKPAHPSTVLPAADSL